MRVPFLLLSSLWDFLWSGIRRAMAFSYMSKSFFKMKDPAIIKDRWSTHAGVMVHLDGFWCVDESSEITRWKMPVNDVKSGAECEQDCLLERSCEVWQWDRLRKICHHGAPQMKNITKTEQVKVNRENARWDNADLPAQLRQVDLAKISLHEVEKNKSSSRLAAFGFSSDLMQTDAFLSETPEHRAVMQERGAEPNPLAACMRGPH
ncbi:unnamed protein product, partial [Amoebophrya sp. A120]|eukprot:GSA120T00012847001.1